MCHHLAGMFALLDKWNDMFGPNAEPKTHVLCKGVLVTKEEPVPGGGTGDWVCSQQRCVDANCDSRAILLRSGSTGVRWVNHLGGQHETQKFL